MAEYNPIVGDVLSFAWPGFFGAAIRIRNYYTHGFDREKNRWTHTAIIGKVSDEQALVYEARAGGFQKSWYTIGELRHYLEKNHMKVCRPKHTLKDVKKHCDSMLGRPYAYHQIAILGYTILGTKALEKFTTSRAVICSESVARILKKSNPTLDLGKEFGKRLDYIIPLDYTYSQHFDFITQ